MATTTSCEVHGFLKACKNINNRKMVSSSRKVAVSAVTTLPKPPQFAAPRTPPPKGLKRVRSSPSDSEPKIVKRANIDGAACRSVPVRQISSVVGRPPAHDGGAAVVVGDQASELSPGRAARVALLRSRFAGTIVKAQHTLLGTSTGFGDQSKSTSTEAKIAGFRALEIARANELIKKQRQRDREAARLALTEMEKNVVIDDNFRTMKEFEMLISGRGHLL